MRISVDMGPADNFLAVDNGDEVAVLPFAQDEFPPADVYVGHECGMLATRVTWAPDDILPGRKCWAIVAVTRGETAAAVGPYGNAWYELAPLDLPWFMASTASGIRASIEKGEPLTPKRVVSAALFDRVVDNLAGPPVDENGRI